MTLGAGRIAIVGGGIAGLSTALGLLDEGFEGRITILDPEPEPGRHGSSRAAGALRRVGRAASETPVSIRSFEAWAELRSRFTTDAGISLGGVLLATSSEAHMSDIVDKYERQRDSGIPVRLVGGDEARALAPGLRDDVVLGLHGPEDGQVEPAAATAAIAGLVLADDRVGFRGGARVTGLSPSGAGWSVELADGSRESADWVVLAAGARSGSILESLGLALPVMAARVVTLGSEPVDARIPVFFQDWDTQLFLRQTATGALQFGLLAQDFVSVGDAVTEEERAWALRALQGSFPALEGVRIVSEWSGIIDETRDRMPVIGALPGAERLLVAAGWSGHGFMLAPYRRTLARAPHRPWRRGPAAGPLRRPALRLLLRNQQRGRLGGRA